MSTMSRWTSSCEVLLQPFGVGIIERMDGVVSEGRSNTTRGGEVIVPMPVVDWKTVVQTDNPAREATRARLRELRQKKLVAAGVTVSRHKGRKLQGRATYYSVLAALAARCRQEGQDDDADFLADAASQLESRFAARLRQFLTHHPLKALPEAQFFDELTKATAEKLAGWTRLPDELLAAAQVSDIEAGIAHLEGTSPRGDPVAVDLPRALLDRQELATGDLVWVSTRLLGSATLVEVLPAVRVWHDMKDFNAHPLRLLSALAGAGTPINSSARGSDGLDPDERMALAARFRATAGADLTTEDLADLRRDAAAGQLPRQRLRPAG
jgi:hypothetical protein